MLLVFHKIAGNTIFIRNSLETRAELAVLCIYVENQAILELILLYRASKFKQTKGSTIDSITQNEESKIAYDYVMMLRNNKFEYMVYI